MAIGMIMRFEKKSLKRRSVLPHKLLLLSAFLCLSYICAEAQTRKGDNEIRVSYGGATMLNDPVIFVDYGDKSIYSFLLSNLGTPVDVSSSGVISASYNYFLKDWLSVGGSIETAFFYTQFENNYSHGKEFSSKWTHGSVTLMGGVRFHFVNKEWVRLYSDVNVGLYMLYGRDCPSVGTDFAFQTSPFGISIGKKVSAFLELDFGTVYNGGNVGISVRF